LRQVLNSEKREIVTREFEFSELETAKVIDNESEYCIHSKNF